MQVDDVRRSERARPLVGGLAVVCALIVVEGVCRHLDGYVIAATALRPSTVRTDSDGAGAPDLQYMRRVATAPGVDREW